MQHRRLLKQVFYFKPLLDLSDCGVRVLLQVRALFPPLLEPVWDQVQDGAEGFLSDRRVSLHQPAVVRNTLSLFINFIYVSPHPLCVKYFLQLKQKVVLVLEVVYKPDLHHVTVSVPIKY